MNELEEHRPRRRRWVPVAIGVLALVIVGGWSAFWWTAKSRVEEQLAAFRASPAARNLTWSQASVGGYPFRIRVDFTDARAAMPDGVGVAAPRLVAQAYLYRPDHWTAAAPDGLRLLRPVSGDVQVRGRAIRASLTNLFAQPRIAVEGVDLTLTPVAGAEPFLFSAMRRFQLEGVQGPPNTDQAAGFLAIEGGQGRPGGLLALIGSGGEASARFEVMVDRASAFSGSDGAAAARGWAEAGGRLTLRLANVRAGAASAETREGVLGVDPDGRLRGVLPLTLTRGARALAGLGAVDSVDDAAAAGAAALTQAQADAAENTRVTVRFAGGRTLVGPFPIGPAPRLF